MDPIINLQNIQPHPRIIIRNKIKELLKVNTDLGGRWFCSRPKPAFINELPCGLIYFSDEILDDQNTKPRNYLRTVSLYTDVLHRLESERENYLDDFLDSRAYEIEKIIFHDRYIGLSGIVEDTVLTRTETSNLTIDGDMDIGSIRLIWAIMYRSDAFSKSQLNEFLNFNVKYETVNNAIAEDEKIIRSA